MWKIIVLLWLIPLTLGLVMLARVARGSPAITDEELRLLFDHHREPTLSLWFGIKLALLSFLSFFVGLAQGLILINIGFLWMVLVPLGTTMGVMFILAWWIRSASNEDSISQRGAAQSHPTDSRTAGMLPR
jgi:hypothetical protein